MAAGHEPMRALEREVTSPRRRRARRLRPRSRFFLAVLRARPQLRARLRHRRRRRAAGGVRAAASRPSIRSRPTPRPTSSRRAGRTSWAPTRPAWTSSRASSTRRASTSRSPLAGTLISAVIGSLLGAAVGYYQTARGLGAVRLAGSSCAPPTCCRPFRCSSSRSPWWPCSGRACRASSSPSPSSTRRSICA